MSDYLLIHGGHHAQWCWDCLIPRLEALGDRAVAIDLPGRGATADRLKTATLDDWVAAIGEAVEGFTSAPILVGHSMGGVATSQYVEQAPATIAGVVYVSAVVPADGTSGVSTIAEAGPESVATQRGVWRFSEDRTAATMDLAAAAEAFYGRCPPDVVEQALSRLCPEPAAPLTTPLRLGASFSSVPKIYIGALEDRTVPPALQHRLAERAGAAFQTIDADHSPFFSAVDELASQLHEAGRDMRSDRKRSG